MLREKEARCDGQDLKRMLAVATAWLEKHSEAINALNVFPVPDGDTGTNMLLTIQAALAEIGNHSNHHPVGSVAQAAAYGALMGARGNSGVILSQILRGMANRLSEEASFGPLEFAEALVEGSTTAYKGIIHPVEGTILTVIRDASQAALATAQKGKDLLEVLEITVEEAKDSVARTPSLLDVLREAGVVDAGGQGLFIILDGALRALRGEAVELAEPSEMEAPETPRIEEREMEWGYCTEFILKGEDLNLEEVRKEIASMGDSAIAVGDDHLIKVHVHTFEPGKVLSYASSLGALSDIKIDNMQEQHREYMVVGKEAAQQEMEGIAIVAVAWGDGLTRVFESLGASRVVPGGQTMNPSTQELLEAIECLPTREVIILPNNENIHLAAEQAQKLSEKKVAVVPTTTIPQGIGALLAFNREADLETNVPVMENAIAAVQTVEITTAVRPAQINGIRIKKGEIIALLNGHLAASGKSIKKVLQESLQGVEAQDCEIITLYYGEDTLASKAQRLAQAIHRWYPEQEVECVDGGQPYYHYIISVE